MVFIGIKVKNASEWFSWHGELTSIWLIGHTLLVHKSKNVLPCRRGWIEFICSSPYLLTRNTTTPHFVILGVLAFVANSMLHAFLEYTVSTSSMLRSEAIAKAFLRMWYLFSMSGRLGSTREDVDCFLYTWKTPTRTMAYVSAEVVFMFKKLTLMYDVLWLQVIQTEGKCMYMHLVSTSDW